MYRGIGEDSSFAAMHPAVSMTFFVFAIGVTMFSVDPLFVGLTLAVSWTYSVLLKGTKAIKSNLLFTLPVFVVMVIINALFVHNGATVLFYLNGQRITLEAVIYGAASAAMLSSVIVWFSCFNVIMTSEKLVFLFGKVTPVLGLTLSMIFRFLPLLKNRFEEISMGQRCMGRHEGKGFLARVRQAAKEVSILISWSLEASIETADSMEARGYGLPGRTSFNLYKMSGKDKASLAVILALGVFAAYGCAKGMTSVYYYPKVVLRAWEPLKTAVFAAFGALLVWPLITDILGVRRWKSLKQND